MGDDSRIDEILGEWRERCDRGEAVDPEDVVREHPDLAEPLRARFRALSLLEGAWPAGTAAGAPHGGPALRAVRDQLSCSSGRSV